MPYKDKEKAKENKRLYYLANKERLSQYYKEKYLKNWEKIGSRVRERYRKNTEKILKRQRRYYQKHKKEISEVNKQWCLENKDKVKKIKARYRENNREKLRSDGRKYSKNNRDKSNRNRKVWRSNNPEKVKEEKLRNHFKISLEEYKEILKKQNNCCGVCNTELKFQKNSPKEPCVDHDHKKGKVKEAIRGILCRKCNSGIGGLKDDPVLLEKAFIWIQRKIKKGMIDPTPLTLKLSRHRKYELKRKYGLSVGQYQTLFSEQNGRCGICDKELNKDAKRGYGINIDHNHITKELRGLLCPLCNRSIGLLKDDPKIIKNAINWIKRSTECV